MLLRREPPTATTVTAQTPDRSSQPASALTDETLYRAYLRTALVATLTLGTTFGAMNLFVIHGGLAASWINPGAHGSAQLFGFIFPFIAGIAIHLLPRFLGTRLVHPRAAYAALVLSGVGVLARVSGQLSVGRGGAGLWLIALGSALLLAGMLLWAFCLAAIRRSARVEQQPFHAWLVAGTLWWLVSGALLASAAADAVLVRDVYRVFQWNDAAYTAALHGGVLCWIIGMLGRMGPVFLALRTDFQRIVRPALPAVQLSVILWVLGSVLESRWFLPQAHGLVIAGGALLSSTSLWIVIKSRIFNRPRKVVVPDDHATLLTARLAFAAWAGAALTMLLHLGLELFARSNHLVADAARHLFAQGFVLLLTFGLATRVVPIFGGVRLVWAESRTICAWLLFASVVLRLVQVPAALGFHRLLVVSALAGIFATLAVVVYSVSLWRTLARDGGAHRSQPVSGAAT